MRCWYNNLYNYSSLVFRDQYERAFKVLEDFENEKGDLIVPYIIAFCGDRGEGITSNGGDQTLGTVLFCLESGRAEC